jgi:anti-sigma regulatory factor (Ser/Thr protein kinase)
VERSADHASYSAASVTGWADDAFARLTGLAAVRRVGLAVVEGGGRRLQFTASDRGSDSAPEWCEVDAYDDVPLNAAIRSRRPVIGEIEELGEAYPAFVERQRDTPYVALAAVPMISAGEVVGGFVLYFDRVQVFDLGQRRDLDGLGRELGTRLRRAQRVGVRRPTVHPDDVGADAGAAVAVHEVAGGPASVGEARRFLRRTLRDWDVDEPVVETATLCLSELVTNAVIHTYGGCLVRVVLRDGAVTVSVRDSGTTSAARLETVADPLQVHGRGLKLVEALATRWGHDVDATGLSVWFELAAD